MKSIASVCIVILSEDCSLREKRKEQPQSKDPCLYFYSLSLGLGCIALRVGVTWRLPEADR